MKAKKSQAKVWLEEIESWDGKMGSESSNIFHGVEDDEEAVVLDFPGLDGTVYVFPDGSVAVVDAEEEEENSYGDTVIRDFSLHTSLPALADWLTTRHTELIKEIQNKIQAVGDTYALACAFSQAEITRARTKRE